MRTLKQIYGDLDIEGDIVLGSVQYLNIWEGYKFYSDHTEDIIHPRDNTDDFIKQLENIIYSIKDSIIAEANDFEETPDLKEWYSLELRLKLLLAKKDDIGDILKETFGGLFQLLKNRSWDLWSALGMWGAYPELAEYKRKIDLLKITESSADSLGLYLYFFSEKLNLVDEEIKNIFGGFDT